MIKSKSIEFLSRTRIKTTYTSPPFLKQYYEGDDDNEEEKAAFKLAPATATRDPQF